MFNNKNQNTLIFIPSTLLLNKSGFIEGFHKKYEDSEAFYITNNTVLSECKNYIGYTGKFLTKDFFGENTIFIEHDSKNIQINPTRDKEDHITQIFYDYEAFNRSDVVCANGDDNYGVHIKELSTRLYKRRRKYTNGSRKSFFNTIMFLISATNIILKICSKVKSIGKNCALFTHLENSFGTAKWFLTVVHQERKISPKTGNVIFAKIIDLILGILLFYFCLKYEDLIMRKFSYLSKDFLMHLRQLLIYLMGSPIGLKLNYAFNHSLGNFFFYHINLWRVFLQAMQPVLSSYYKILLVPAFFGASYQIAILCDIISVATFHVYCIYVYAARLFSLQIRGLTSLWRLFIGRKFNPLRFRVDSCEYSSNQLFIGTLGFTILLFLLPTTTMYYSIFAIFRLLILIVYTTVAKIKDLISRIPLYIIILWAFRSSCTAGTLEIELKQSDEQNTQIEAKLSPLPLTECIKIFSMSSVQTLQPKDSFGKIAHHLFTGQLV